MVTEHAHLVRFEGVIHGWLVARSIAVLRISLGVVFLGFGVLKFFPGVSPAEDLVRATIEVMTLHVITGHLGVVITAVIECFIGFSLIWGRWVRLTLYVLVAELLGILSPLVLLPGRLFAGPFHAPTLEGQYVLKDVVLVSAAMVVATQFRGAAIVAPENWDLDRHEIAEDPVPAVDQPTDPDAPGPAPCPAPGPAPGPVEGPGSGSGG